MSSYNIVKGCTFVPRFFSNPFADNVYKTNKFVSFSDIAYLIFSLSDFIIILWLVIIARNTQKNITPLICNVKIFICFCFLTKA